MYREDISTYVERLAEKYKDKEFNFPYDFCRSANLKKIAFMLITPDAVKRGLHNEIIKYLYYDKNYQFLLCKAIELSSYQIEELYKYSFQRKVMEGEPSYWWLMERCLQMGPSLAFLLYDPSEIPGYFSERLTLLKGEYRGQEELGQGETIRTKFKSISRILNNIHCSDDIYQVIREAKIFFTYNEIGNALCKVECEKFIDINILLNLLNGGDKVTTDYGMMVSEIEGKIIAKLAMVLNKNYIDTRSFLKQIELTEPLKEELSTDSSIQYRLIFLYKAITTKKCSGIQKIDDFLNMNDVILSDFEKNVILNIVVFSKYKDYEYA